METIKPSKSSGQFPYVIYNGEEVVDSNFIIDYFCQERGIDEGDGLTDEQKAAGAAIIAMLDDQFSW